MENSRLLPKAVVIFVGAGVVGSGAAVVTLLLQNTIKELGIGRVSKQTIRILTLHSECCIDPALRTGPRSWAVHRIL